MNTMNMQIILIPIIIILFMLMIRTLWRLFFVRDPIRHTPSGNVIVAPADGYVVYIKRVDDGKIPVAIKKKQIIPLVELTDVEQFQATNGWLIGIYMTPWSVHRNRIPISGEIILKKYFKNKYNILMTKKVIETIFKLKFTDDKFYLTNERLTIGIKTKKGKVYVTQIADKLTNRILAWKSIGDQVSVGEQYGMILFGSQCDLFIPDTLNISIEVKARDYLYAGETIIGTYPIV